MKTILSVIKRYDALLSSFIFRIISAAVGVILSITLANTQEKNVLGEFFVILSMANLLSNLICYGSAPFINKSIACKTNIIELIKRLLPVYLFSLLCCLFVAKFIAVLYEIKIIFPFVLSSIFVSVQTLFCEVLKGQGEYRFSQILSGPLANLIFILALLVFHYQSTYGYLDINTIYYVWLCCLTISTLILVLFLMSRRSELNFISGEKIEIKFKDLTFIFFSSLIVYSMSQADLWIIAKKFNAGVLAEYGLSIRLALAFSFSVISVRVIAASKIPKLFGKNHALLQDEISRSCRFSFLITTIGVIVIYYFGDDIINYMFGDKFHNVKNILLILSVGQVVNALTGPCDYLLSHCGHQNSLFKITLLSFVFEVILFFLIMPLTVNIYVYALVVSTVIAIQNGLVAFVAYKKTNIISFPINFRF